jgi:hypothetical protein
VGINISKEYAASIFRAEDGRSVFLQNVGIDLQVQIISQPTDSRLHIITFNRTDELPITFTAFLYKQRIYNEDKGGKRETENLPSYGWRLWR